MITPSPSPPNSTEGGNYGAYDVPTAQILKGPPAPKRILTQIPPLEAVGPSRRGYVNPPTHITPPLENVESLQVTKS